MLQHSKIEKMKKKYFITTETPQISTAHHRIFHAMKLARFQTLVQSHISSSDETLAY